MQNSSEYLPTHSIGKGPKTKCQTQLQHQTTDTKQQQRLDTKHNTKKQTQHLTQDVVCMTNSLVKGLLRPC